MKKSRALQKLRAGEVVRMVNISRVTDPWLSEVAGTLGFDVIWLDLEHRDFSDNVIAPMALACRAVGTDLLVRIRKSGYFSPMIALESGAQGIMVPHCRSAEETRQWVEWCKFPPQGKRGFDGAGSDADYSAAKPLEHINHANRETFVAVQIEDAEAVECIDEIAAVEGVDLLFIGPGDLSISYGVPMEVNHPKMQRAFERAAAATLKAGKWWGTVVSSPEIAQRYVDMGARLINCGSDHGCLVRGLKKAFEDYQPVKGN
jgi:4-hydroxy-2-oxoheptanedioate aldolase